MKEKSDVKVVASNRKARHDYIIEETFEAGIVLTGTEIKSIRAGRVNLQDSFAMIRGGEVWLIGAHVSPYSHGNRENHEPRRERKLLMHRREILRLHGKIQEKGWTLIPLQIHLRNGRAKVQLGLARGKKLYDKRDSIAKHDHDREMRRALKEMYH
ncbi:MAG: SsrA-binding protein SmpB [Anaerolineae bacterium]|nr:SsrA-binding protein SmpB [Anaerolineae bacterium]MCB9131829.1 SsrA-binding protein SmpB [Anaerolineales bacterium]MCB0228085.1 SsrA-binding protein SmpB [Anaerolineae bacterium]MCB0234065.1 SsrA-binding protein SmpB [Anaerolineae bacterium]MCB0239472.1 SsrA-binding protein SmpB [Anaerolineae bacterium]